jgi:hypothetical protein
VVGDAVLVACHENEVVGIDGRTGARLGALRAPAEIATPPVVVDGVMFLGLRDRSVVGLRLGASSPSAPASAPAGSSRAPVPEQPQPAKPPRPPPPQP